MLARLNFDPAESLIPLMFGLLAAGVGVLAGVDPRFAVAASLGVAFLLVALASLPLGLVAFALVLFLELAPAIGGPALSFTKIAGGILALSWLATYASRDRPEEAFWVSHPTLTTLLAVWVAWVAASYFWAEDPGQAGEAAARIGLNAVLFVIVYEALRDRRHVRLLVGAFVVGATIAAAYGFIAAPDASRFALSATAASGLNRLAGTVGDPNLLAALLVVGLIMALALGASERRSPSVRTMSFLGAAICAGGVFLTGSRGGLIALGAALLASVALTPRRRALAAVIAASIVFAGGFYYTTIAPESTVERLSSNDGGSGRTDIWKVGWRMVEDNPVRGVGAANFQVSSIHYLLSEPGSIESDTYIVDQPAVAHNTYLELLAELGVIGLALFLAIAAASISCSARAARAFSRSGDRMMEALSLAIVVSLIALLAADFFISEQYSKQLWLLLATGPALLGIATRTAAETQRGSPAT